MEAYSVRIDGRVQGVGFRYWTCRLASRFDIKGWVRNNSDGSVSVFAESADGDKMAFFLNELKKGPSSSYIRNFEIRETVPENCFDFDIRF